MLFTFCTGLTMEASQTLTTLNLEGNRMGDAIATHLASALRVNQVRPPFFMSWKNLMMKTITDTHNTNPVNKPDWR